MPGAPPLAAIARYVPHVGRLGRATRWRRTRGRPRVWAHRGASAHEVENTFAAFERARADGADGIELDVRLDGGGTVVVFHDAELRRLCDRPGRMAELSTEERAALRVGGHPVPTLAEVLAWLGELELNVEIKADRPGRAGPLVEATARAIAQSRRADQIIVSSFDPVALVQFHAHLPEVALAYLFHAHQSLPLRTGWAGRWIGASALHPSHELVTRESVAKWRRAGVALNVWTVDDKTELERLARLGIDGVFCNDPGHALEVFAGLGPSAPRA
jgi:glycerophosphoryl diester phosphodiesterase